MAKVRTLKNEIEVRLQTVEEKIEEIFGRVGLLDEQARQAGYRAYLAVLQLNQETRGRLGSNERSAAEGKRGDVAAFEARPPHQRAETLASKRRTHSSR